MRTIILMLEDGSSYVLKDQIAQLEAFLKEHGYDNRAMNKLFNAADAKVKADTKPEQTSSNLFGKVTKKGERPSLSQVYLEILKQEKEKVASKIKEPVADVDVDQDMFQSGPEELISNSELNKLAGSNEKRPTNRDEGMIKVLQLLAQQLRPQGKDKARVIAARMKVNSDVFEMAGLGRLPLDFGSTAEAQANYSDEDVWKTLDMAKNNDGSVKPFYDSAWQTLYTGALEQMQSLPLETRDYIEELITSKQEVSYPTKPYDRYSTKVQDDRTAFECKTLTDIISESNGSMDIIPAGTKIIIS